MATNNALKYLQAASEILDRIVSTQMDAIDRAAGAGHPSATIRARRSGALCPDVDPQIDQVVVETKVGLDRVGYGPQAIHRHRADVYSQGGDTDHSSLI